MTRQDKFRSVPVAVATLVIAALLAAPGRAQSAVGWWTFDNPLDLGADSSTSGNHLTENGGVAYDAGGKFGGALSLDGGDDMLSHDTFPTAVPTGDDPFSISAWIKPDQIGNRGIVGWGGYGGADGDTNAFRIRDPNNIRNYWWADDLGADAGVDLVNGDWHHAVATYDGTTRALWVNDTLVGSDTPGTHNTQATNFTVGHTCANCGGGEFWDGLLDDVAIFDYALSNDDINALFTGAETPGSIPEPGPAPTDFEWNVDSTGSWEFASNWTGGGPPGLDPTTNANHTVTFGDLITQARTVVSDSAVSVRAITFDHNDTYAVAGTGSVSLVQGTATGSPANSSIAVLQGTHEFQLPVTLGNNTDVDVATGSNLTFQNALDLNGNTLTKTGDGTLSIRNDLITSGGTLNVTEGSVSGNGTVGGNLSNTGGTIAPGNSLGAGGAVQGIPEPSTVVLLCLGSVIVIAARAWPQNGRQIN